MAITVKGLDEVIGAFEGTIKGYPKMTSEFLNKEGRKLKKVIERKKEENGVGTITGNYREGIKKGKPYQYYKSNGSKTKDSVKVYGKRPPAYHTHLIEKGHQKVLWGYRTAERVKAFYVYSDAEKEFKPSFEDNCEEFVNNALTKLLWN